MKQTGQQVRQLLRGGDAEGALRGACESAPWGASAESVKVCSGCSLCHPYIGSHVNILNNPWTEDV